jgi:hypothetical protein
MMVAAAGAWVGCSSSSAPSDGRPTTPEDGASSDASAVSESEAAQPDHSSGAESTPSGDAGDDGGVVSSPDCIQYCNTIEPACAADYPQFGTMTACLRACAAYPPGDPTDESGTGNTLKCRQQHAMSAANGGTYHCFHAGPYGYGGCGSMCEGFCQLAMAWCAGSSGGAPFASAAACTTECESWPLAPSGADGLAAYRAYGPTSGDTLECREYQLVKSLESLADRDTYCPRAATSSVACR